MMGEAFDKLATGVKKWSETRSARCIGMYYAWQWNMVVLAMLIGEMGFEMVNPSCLQARANEWFDLRFVELMIRAKPRGQ